jgi:IS30 family transposase
MSRRVWRRISSQERAELWHRWKQGESVSEIARGLGREKSHVHTLLQEQGGICPAGRRRAECGLTLAHREEVSRGLCAGFSYHQIARRIGKAVSTVSREVHRNGGRECYRASQAEAAAWDGARRPKRCKLQQNTQLRRYIARGLAQQWSPQQIARRLEQDYPDDHSMRVSHETIYRSLFVQARGVLKKELTAQLRYPDLGHDHRWAHPAHVRNEPTGPGPRRSRRCPARYPSRSALRNRRRT